MKRLLERFQEFGKNRIFIMLCGIGVLFFILVTRLFYLQIIHGEAYQQKLTTSVLKSVDLPASRGSIYDRYGRPLAINHAAYSVKIDDSINIDLKEQKNKLILDYYEKLKQANYTIGENLPISKSAPYSFTFSGTEKEIKKAEKQWKEAADIPKSQMELSAEDTLNLLFQLKEIPNHYSLEEKRSILSLNLSTSDKNLMVLTLLQTLNENNETLVDDLPISPTEPYTFLFDDNKSKEHSWKQSVIGMSSKELSYNATQTIEYLRDFFGLSEILPKEIIRQAISQRYAMYLERFRKYQPVTVALDVSDKTLASVEENQDTFPGVIIDTDSLRSYPEGEYFSHILGYIRKMDSDDYNEYKDDVTADGELKYSVTDIVGKTGIEKYAERELNGTDGEMMVEVDSLGRRMNTLEAVEPVSGKDIFLTLDSRLQKASFQSLENTLKGIVKRKLNYQAGKDSISLQQLFITMINANKIPIAQICGAKDGEQLAIYNKILASNPEFNLSGEEDLIFAKQVITDCLERGEITPTQMVLVLIEQGKFTADAEYLAGIQSGQISALQVINDKLDSGELRPGDTALDPCTGSVVVSRVDSGEVLASVSYPSYDNNRLVNNFDNAYYNQLVMDTETSPLYNRPMREKKAPGSTFKMVTALAGLETGVITPKTHIRDEGIYTKASRPHPKCWIYGGGGGTHGSIDVAKALEVSCNYFFYETAFRMGNAEEGTTEQSITTLNEYMAAFGLNHKTGIEIGEAEPTMASPDSKEHSIRTLNPEATSTQIYWSDGDSVRTAIGQSVNSYAPIHLNKYIATLANGGTKYKMHLISKIENPDGTIDTKVDEVVENVLELQPENLAAVFRGMLQVTTGINGTLRGVFADFPVQVAAKSGTAQENLARNSHTWFVGFAPYDDPQIAITVMIPFGEMSGAPAAVVGREIIGEYMGLNYEPSNHYMENMLAE